MIHGIDHLAIAVHDPDAAIAELASTLGIPAGVSGGRHNAWGTRNRLLWLGDTFIELVTVFDARLAERSWLGRATLAALEANPNAATAVAWAISTDDLDLDRAELNAAGASLGKPTAGERRRTDGTVVRWRLSLPPDVDLARPFLIEHDMTAAEWTPEDRANRAASPARVAGLALPVGAIEGLPDVEDGAALGDQVVGIADRDDARPIVRVTGLNRGAAVADALGCRWLID